MTNTPYFAGNLSRICFVFSMINLHTKFEVPRFRHSKDMEEDTKLKMGVIWGD